MGERKISASDLGTLGAYRMHSIVRKRKSGPGENNGYRCKRARDAIVPAQTPVRRRSALRREPIDDRVPGVAKKAAAAGANFDGHCRREQAEELREHGVSLVRGSLPNAGKYNRTPQREASKFFGAGREDRMDCSAANGDGSPALDGTAHARTLASATVHARSRSGCGAAPIPDVSSARTLGTPAESRTRSTSGPDRSSA